MNERFSGKAALVTGGASGIGEATVRRFVEEGGRAIIADVDVERGQQLAGQLGDATRFLCTDVSVEDDIATAVQTAASEFGRLDLMFNNAGIIGAVGPISSITGEAYDRTMAVLVHSVVMGMKHAATVMIPQRTGTIVSTSSVAAVAGGLGGHMYSAAKAAVLGLTRSVAAELWSYGIRVNAVVPGKITTPMTDALRGGRPADEDPDEAMLTDRRGEARDVAAAVLYLASDDGRFITAEAFRIDGGLTLAGRPSAFATGNYTTPSMIGGRR
jgi:NAD(P)-dependent dehydrogenase (short-subunit alcohol dehydrogenase family)